MKDWGVAVFLMAVAIGAIGGWIWQGGVGAIVGAIVGAVVGGIVVSIGERTGL